MLEEDGWVLPESAVIAEFLNERYPEPPLWPDDPGERAAGRLLVFRFDDFSKPYYAFRRGEEGALARFEEELGFLDVLLQGTPWLSGRAFGLADIAFLPWLLRARDMLGISLEPWPALAAWLEPRLRAAVGRGRERARGDAVTDVTLAEVVSRLDEEGYVLLDVRSTHEYTGEVAAPCDPRPGRIPGARHFDLQELMAFTPSRSASGSARPEAWSSSPTATPARAPSSRRRSSVARVPRVQLPRLVARVVAGRVAARRSSARPPRGRRGRARGRARSSPRCARASRQLRPAGSGDVVRILADPRLDLLGPHLRVELDTPGVSEPECLRADAAARQLDGSGRERVGVVVPLEGVEPLGQRSRDRVVAPRQSVRSTGSQPTSDSLERKTSAPAARATSCEPRQTPSSGVPWSSKPSSQRSSVRQPAVPLVLVGVHRAAEDDHRVGALGRPGRSSCTGHSTSSCPASRTASAKTPGPTLGPWRDGEDTHDPSPPLLLRLRRR